MRNKRNIMVLAVALFALIIVGVLPAQTPPKAKTAEGSVRVEVPEQMVEFFEAQGVDLSGVDPSGSMPEATEAAINAVYEAEDSLGDRVYSSRVNGIAVGALEDAYAEANNPVYLEFGPLYWGYWKGKDGLNESDL